MTAASAGAGYRIIFEDRWLIAADKSPGVLVIETPKKEKNTLTRSLNAYLDSKGIGVNAYPCHRIDRDTSGLVLYAKGKSAQKKMMELFRLRGVKKGYIAFVHGRLKYPSGTIRRGLYNRNKRRTEDAITSYRTVESKGEFSVLEVEPVTGRTNQIRRHFAQIGHPLLGERVYAFARDYKLKFRRTALHAKDLKFTHPVTGREVSLTTGLPEDMAAFKKLF